MSNLLRFQVVEEAFKKKAVEVKVPSERPSEYFGKYVFNREKMYKYLPEERGGLKSLRKMAEDAGFDMKIETAGGFKLILNLSS